MPRSRGGSRRSKGRWPSLRRRRSRSGTATRSRCRRSVQRMPQGRPPSRRRSRLLPQSRRHRLLPPSRRHRLLRRPRLLPRRRPLRQPRRPKRKRKGACLRPSGSACREIRWRAAPERPCRRPAAGAGAVRWRRRRCRRHPDPRRRPKPPRRGRHPRRLRRARSSLRTTWTRLPRTSPARRRCAQTRHPPFLGREPRSWPGPPWRHLARRLSRLRWSDPQDLKSPRRPRIHLHPWRTLSLLPRRPSHSLRAPNRRPSRLQQCPNRCRPHRRETRRPVVQFLRRPWPKPK